MVADSNARIDALKAFILEHVCDHKSHFEVSDVKQDGTVFVRFRGCRKGSYGASAAEEAQRFNQALWASKVEFVQTDDVKFRLALKQFGG